MSHSLALCTRVAVILTATFAVACGSDDDEPASEVEALQPSFSFFVTSVGSGEDGGDLGGLAGADATCEQLAEAAQPGAEARTWRAYLSTEDENARDRIGDGPWYNVNDEMIAQDLASLLSPDPVFNGAQNMIVDENGTNAPGPEHDILTGSDAMGMLMLKDDGTPDNCDNWTSSSEALTAFVGHSDIPGNPMFSPSWNAAHQTQSCTQEGLVAFGGAGRLYCFAAD